MREAIRSVGISQKDLVKKIGKARQTVSRYLTQFENTGSVGDKVAQEEFERIMALYQQQLDSDTNRDKLLEIIRNEKNKLIDKEEAANEAYKKFIDAMLKKYPQVQVFDWNDKLVDHEHFDWDEEWINIGEYDNETLLAALTDQEKSKLDSIICEMSTSFLDVVKKTELEDSYLLEKLWDTTNPGGKPIVYDDTFDCILEAEEVGGELYEISCKTLCMCNGETARIYVEELSLPDTEHELEFDVTAFIKVLTDRGTFHIENVDMECLGAPYEFVGQIDDLIPGYKYVFGIAVSLNGSTENLTEKESSLAEGYYTAMHPLK